MYVAWGNPDSQAGSGSGSSGFDCNGGGFFKFAANTVNVAYHWIPKHSLVTGNRYAAEGIMVLRGRLMECDGGAALSDQIDEMIDAFSYDGRTLGLYRDDDSVTQHVLPNDVASLVDGPKVTRYSFPRGDRAEYADNGHRSFYIEVHALYDYSEACDLVPGIIEYHERFRYEGFGGPQWTKWYDQTNTLRTWNGGMLTPTRLIQTGYAKGWGGYVTPLPPVETASVHWDQCVEEYGSPTSGMVLGAGAMTGVSKEYWTRWMYPMTLASFYGQSFPYFPQTKV